MTGKNDGGYVYPQEMRDLKKTKPYNGITRRNKLIDDLVVEIVGEILNKANASFDEKIKNRITLGLAEEVVDAAILIADEVIKKTSNHS